MDFDVSLDGHGLGALLNGAEKSILEFLWRGEGAFVKDVHRAVATKHGLTHVTICVYLDRLYDKGVVDRRPVPGKGGLKYWYFPRVKKQEFGEQVAKRLALILRQAFGAATANYFMKEAGKVSKSD